MRNSDMIPRRIGAVLKRYIASRQMSLREAASFLGTNFSKLDRYLKGANQKVEPGLITGWLHMLGAPAEVIQEAEAMAMQTRSRTSTGWGSSLPEWFSPFVGLEGLATAIDSYQPESLPGMLQTPEYAVQITKASAFLTPEDEEDTIRVRLSRQEVLERAEGKPDMRFVLTEHCFRLMQRYDFYGAQMTRLEEINSLEEVTIYVLSETHGMHPSQGGPYTIMSFDDTPDPDTVYLQSQKGAQYESAAKQVTGYRKLFTATIEAADPLERSAPMSKWRKSTRSAQQGDCVELRSAAGGFQIRDSKLGEDSPILDLTGSDLTSLLRSTKSLQTQRLWPSRSVRGGHSRSRHFCTLCVSLIDSGDWTCNGFSTRASREFQ